MIVEINDDGVLVAISGDRYVTMSWEEYNEYISA